MHTQTLCGIAHFDRDKRYSYEQLFQVMRRLYLPYPDMGEIYRRMVFNVVARTHDDHTKNHSFMMTEDGKWSLAPAYDLCYAYSPSGKWTSQHQLSLNGKRDNITRNDLLAVGKKMSINNCENIIDQVVDVFADWEIYAKEVGVKKEYAEQIKETLRLLHK